MSTLKEVSAHPVIVIVNDIVESFLELLLLHRSQSCVNIDHIDVFLVFDELT